MKVKCMYYNKRFTTKPIDYEVIDIQKHLLPAEVSIKELAEKLSHGASFKPAYLNGTKSKDWVSQQLFALDFDHGTTINEQLNKCKELSILPCFGYTSFSHSEQEHRFRLVFCTDTAITDREVRDQLQCALINCFDKSDLVTKDCTRIFFGGKKLICNDYNNRINAEEIIERYYITPTPQRRVNSQNAPKEKGNPKCSTINNTSNNATNNNALKIEAIRSLNVELMRYAIMGGVLGGCDKEVYIPSSITPYKNPPVEFCNCGQIYDYINKLDLCEYLGIYNYVNCILPEHNDSKPSAHIFKTDDGTQIYKCFGCNKSYTIISITEKLAGCSRSEAIEFIKNVYNIKLVQSEWVKSWKQILIDNTNYLDSNDFIITYPELANLIRTRKHHLKDILIYFSQHVNDKLQVDGIPIFFSNYKTLMDVCGIQANKYDKLSQSLTLFAILNMITKVPESDIPESELKKAKHIAAKYNHKKLTGFYSFNEYGTVFFEDSDRIAAILKSNNFTLRGLSREYVLRTFGVDLADKVYPQYKHENSQGTSKQSDERTSQIVECLFYCIDKNGYATEKSILDLMGNKKSNEIQIKKSLQEILQTYDLTRLRANKQIKEQYNIEGNGFPFIIVKN